MKSKIINLWLLLAVIGFASCSKSAEFTNLDEIQIDKNVVEQVLASKNPEEQKLMYKTLNASEKSFAWQTKYEKLVIDSRLTKEQINFIEKLKSNLNKRIFEKVNNPLKDKFLALESTFKKEAIELFGISGAYGLMASLDPVEQIPPGQGSCDCSKVSDWCPSGHSCIRVGCRIIPDDCGWWWNYDCTGDCWIGTA